MGGILFDNRFEAAGSIPVLGEPEVCKPFDKSGIGKLVIGLERPFTTEDGFIEETEAVNGSSQCDKHLIGVGIVFKRTFKPPDRLGISPDTDTRCSAPVPFLSIVVHRTCRLPVTRKGPVSRYNAYCRYQ
jgi:hypothetical protein